MHSPWRITEIWQKTIYIVLGSAVLALFFWALRTWLLDPRAWPYALVGLVINLAYTLFGVRSFRGYLEPIAPPRAWWRWTGRPKAGYWLGSLQVIGGIDAIREFWPSHGLSPEVPVVTLNILEGAVLGFGYLHSSFRLQRHPELWSQRRRKPTAPEASGAA